MADQDLSDPMVDHVDDKNKNSKFKAKLQRFKKSRAGRNFKKVIYGLINVCLVAYKCLSCLIAFYVVL